LITPSFVHITEHVW